MSVDTILPDGSAFFVVSMPKRGFFKQWWHKLFNCHTFWSLKPFYHCSKCGKGMRCYWDGNDVEGHDIDICNKCAKQLQPIISSINT